ncbi:MAG: dTDP-glucose 4,6-dehydratase [Bacilli bacterium]
MKILVTGGCGFIGCNFVKLIMGKYKDYNIVVVDCLTYAGSLKNIEIFQKNSHFKFIKANICDKHTMDNIFNNEKFDYVVNFAAETSVDKSFLNPNLFFESNVLGTLNLLDLSRKYNIKRFHQISTDEVYGDLKKEKKISFKEKDSLNPTNPYSYSKACADNYVLMYSKIYDLDCTISRCSNNYGPHQFVEKLVPLVISRAKNNYKIPLYGKGKNERDWIFVYDHCTAIEKILFNGKKGNIYNISSGVIKTNIDVVTNILKIMKKPNTLISSVKGRLVNDSKYALNTHKIRHDLGWKPMVDYKTGIKETIDFYLSK